MRGWWAALLVEDEATRRGRELHGPCGAGARAVLRVRPGVVRLELPGARLRGPLPLLLRPLRALRGQLVELLIEEALHALALLAAPRELLRLFLRGELLLNAALLPALPRPLPPLRLHLRRRELGRRGAVLRFEAELVAGVPNRSAHLLHILALLDALVDTAPIRQTARARPNISGAAAHRLVGRSAGRRVGRSHRIGWPPARRTATPEP
mmetsp:Transcript_106125/g.297055  ORF Transcript_106125/g.297055 Transcript_106125/m.297055 type:complete len:210 (+) Transcript_106125:981-1610(+)